MAKETPAAFARRVLAEEFAEMATAAIIRVQEESEGETDKIQAARMKSFKSNINQIRSRIAILKQATFMWEI